MEIAICIALFITLELEKQRGKEEASISLCNLLEDFNNTVVNSYIFTSFLKYRE